MTKTTSKQAHVCVSLQLRATFVTDKHGAIRPRRLETKSWKTVGLGVAPSICLKRATSMIAALLCAAGLFLLGSCEIQRRGVKPNKALSCSLQWVAQVLYASTEFFHHRELRLAQ